MIFAQIRDMYRRTGFGGTGNRHRRTWMNNDTKLDLIAV